MTTPRQLTALSDPENVLFELVDETAAPTGPGFMVDEAYAFLAGADTNTFGVPKIVIADAGRSHFDPDQERDTTGKWTKVGDNADFPEISHDSALAMQDEMLKFDSKQRKTIRDYTGLGFKKINATLRNAKFKLFNSGDVSILKSAMSPTTRNLRAFRTTKLDNC